MDRIKVLLPEQFIFSAFLTIRITDINYGGHVGNDAILSLVHEARQQFLLQFGYSEMNFAGSSLIMADTAIEYKHELYHRDEIKISVAAAGFDKIGFDLFYLMEVKKEDKWIVAGKIKTGMICFDYVSKKKISVPQEAIERITK